MPKKESRKAETKVKVKTSSKSKAASPTRTQDNQKRELISFVVQGHVLTSDGNPLSGRTIKAFDRNVGAPDTLLGQSATDARGRYSISYPQKVLSGKTAADLVLSVYGESNLLRNSDVIFNARPTETIDFLLPTPPAPEFQRISDAIKPLLGRRVALGELRQNQIDFLNKKTGIEARKVNWLAESQRLAGKNLTLQLFYYGLLSQDFPTDPESLLRQDPKSIILALKRAGARGFTAELKPEEIDSILNQTLPRLRAENLLAPAAAGHAVSLGDILQTAGQPLTDDERYKVADTISRIGVDYGRLQDQLKTAGLAPEKAIVVERTLRLADLTNNNLALMRDLQQATLAEKDASLRSLVNIGRDQWIDKAYAYGVPDEAGPAPEAYAERLQASVEKLHPTATLIARLNTGDLVFAGAGFDKQRITTFLTNNSSFDLLASNIPAFVETANLNGIEDKEQLAQSLLKLQRARKLSANWDETSAMLNNGLDSALRIVGIGGERLQQMLSTDIAPERAALIYQNARKTHYLGLALMSRLMTRFSPTPVAAMASSTRLNETVIKERLKAFPALRELFGSLDCCECNPDHSVLSPAAYLVDLLQILANAEDTAGGITIPGAAGEKPPERHGLTAMLERRPDIADLQLSSPNTETELPYIDLVLEILENAVALPLTIDVPGADTDAALHDAASGKSKLPHEILQALQTTSLDPVTNEITVTKGPDDFTTDPADAWIIADQERRWTLRNQAGSVVLYDAQNPKLTNRLASREVKGVQLTDDLDHGRLPAALEAQIEALQKQNRRRRFLSLVKYRVVPVTAGKQWHVACRIGAQITTRLDGEVGMLILQTSAGKTLFRGKYSSKAIEASLEGLQKGRISGILSALVPESEGFHIEQNEKGISIDFPFDVHVIIVPDSLTLLALSYQTTGNTEDLTAMPRNQNPCAYSAPAQAKGNDSKSLRGVSFPWSLPFNLPLEAMRAFLERAGISRRRLIELCKPTDYLHDRPWVYEMLGISTEEAKLITTVAISPQIWPLWGLPPDTKDQDNISVVDSATGKPVSGAPLTVLSTVSIIMQQARITFDELQSILHTSFVGASSLKFGLIEETDSECSPSNLRIGELRADHLDRIHRFVRLWRKLKWDIRDLDFALYVFHDHKINDDFLLFLSLIKRLQEALGLSTKELVSWWGFAGTQTFLYTSYSLPGEPLNKSLYEERFLDPLLQNASDPDLALNDTKSALANSGVTLRKKVPVLAAVLGISQEDFTTFLTQSGLIDKLSFDSLFSLYRTVGLVRALGISFQDFFALQSELDYNLLNTSSTFTEDMVNFCEAAAFVQNSGFSMEELGYLLQHKAPAGSALALDDDQIAEKLSTLLSALQSQLRSKEQQVRDLVNGNQGGPVVLALLTGQDAVNADAAALAIEYAPGDSPSRVTSDLMLSVRGCNNTAITWTSTSPNVVKGSAFQNYEIWNITSPASTADDISLTLTAQIRNSDPSTKPVIRNFDIKLLKQPPDDQTALKDAAAALTIGYAQGDTSSSVTGDFTLPVRGINNTAIGWSSNSSRIGKGSDVLNYSIRNITRPVFTDDDAAVTLTATISLKGNATVTKEFAITIAKQLSGEEAVQADAIALSIGYAPGDGPHGVTQNLVLVKMSTNGSGITWHSGNSAIIDSNGVVTRPASSEGNVPVVMKATITSSDKSVFITRSFYSPDLLDRPILDRNLLANILSDQGLCQQLSDFAVGSLAGAFGLEVAIARQLLVSDASQSALLYFEDGADTTRRDGIEAVLEPIFLSADPKCASDPALFPDLFTLARRLQKAAVILLRLTVTPEQLSWFASPPSGMAALNLNDLPVKETPGADSLFNTWQKLVTLFQMRDRAQAMAPLLTQYIAALNTPSDSATGEPAKTEARKVLVKALAAFQTATDAEVSDGARLMEKSTILLGTNTLADYRDPVRLSQLMNMLSAMKALGADADQVEDLTRESTALTAEDEVLARWLLRAKYGTDSWRDIVKPVSDKLRVRQRDALVDYLIFANGLKDADDLYEYYLIDPQMSSGMLTSRLVQATASVQLFIQRCMLNLEQVTLNEDDRQRWEWMKNYRVWQANREVFLFPENWLHPELRDDKSDLFKAFESGIAQGEPNYQLAKDNLLAYIDDYAHIARMIVFGMYEDIDEDSGKRTLYVVGRTPDQPYQYFWRRSEEFGEKAMYWHGWERIEMDVSDDHLMPFVFDGMLYIAWPVMKEAVDEVTKEKRWGIQLAWISRSATGWSQRKVSKESVSLKALPNISQERIVSLRAQTSREQVVFHIYGAEEVEAPMLALPKNDIVYDSWPSDLTASLAIYKEFTLPDGSKAYEQIRPPSLGMTIYYDIFEWTEKPGPSTPGKGDYINKDQDQVVLLTLNNDNTYSFFGKKDHSSFDNVQNKTRWVEWRYKQAVISVSPADNCTRPPQITLSAPEDQYLISFSLHVAMSCTEQPQSVSPDRKLKMLPTWKFVLTRAKDIGIEDGSGSPDLTSLYCAGSFENGYKEYPEYANGTGAFLTVPNALVFSTLPQGGFFTVRAGKTDLPDEVSGGTWYYEDNLIKFYFQIKLKAKDNFQNCLLALIEWPPTAFNLRGFAYDRLEALYQPEVQSTNDKGKLFQSNYVSNDVVDGSVEIGITFDLRFPSAVYNWEIFYHIPILVAEFLTRHQRFDDAERWLSYLFDPTACTGGSDKLKNVWQFLPFRDAGDNLEELFTAVAKLVASENLTQTEESAVCAFDAQIQNWLASPFSPFAVARARWTAFQWRTIFSYLDSLIARGDQMFRRFTLESVNEAVQYYVLASKLLGPRPQSIRPQNQDPDLSYRDIYGKWDEFSKAWYTITDAWPSQGETANAASTDGQTEALSALGMAYFCIPHNEKLLGYWDTVEDRLFKVRNCMDIDGVARELPLFAPPIDPELLVRAFAAGLDIDTILDDLYAPLLPYRFSVLLQKAHEICAEVKSLGGALLAALEKKDAEELALLRSSQEIEMLNLMALIKEQQAKEAEANLDVLSQNMAVVLARYNQYQKLLGKPAATLDQNGLPVLTSSSSLQAAANLPGEAAGLGLTQYEVDQLNSLSEANDYTTAAGISSTVASILHSMPDFVSGNSMYLQVKIGGSHFGNAANAAASFLNMLASRASHEATEKGLFASYQRRQDEWVFQGRLALEEMKQINKQIIAAEIRLEIARREEQNHQKQIENARTVDEFMHRKYTNRELYSWMLGELATVYFTAYKLANDTGKRAEKAFQFELGKEDGSFIQFGYWDSLKKGLLSGEKLSLDLKRMEMAYLEQNRRELEISKHLSLLQLDPLALIGLKETGTCEVSIPEALFDIDFPGHYFRRIKSVSITIPCVAGPYTSVSCTLRLLKHSFRKTAQVGSDGYPRKTNAGGIPADDSRFTDSFGSIQSIATSHGQNDNGMFELNFRDERYLPFEGAGAISTWRIELPKKFRQFDYDTISDAIIHLKYTARDGGDVLAEKATDNLNKALNEIISLSRQSGLLRLFSLRHEFPNEWQRFINEKSTDFKIEKGRLPFFAQNAKLTSFRFVAKDDVTDDTIQVKKNKTRGTAPDSESLNVTWGQMTEGIYLGNLPESFNVSFDEPLTLSASGTDDLKELYILVGYTLTER